MFFLFTFLINLNIEIIGKINGNIAVGEECSKALCDRDCTDYFLFISA
jgi:hypothetical protein